MKAGELFKLLSDEKCGDDVLVFFEGKTIEIDALYDVCNGQFILEGGQYTEDEEDESEEE